MGEPAPAWRQGRGLEEAPPHSYLGLPYPAPESCRVKARSSLCLSHQAVAYPQRRVSAALGHLTSSQGDLYLQWPLMQRPA
ncbi:P2Y Purinoceptor 1 [Manis pentadactyla]|nr:P2Y Purinoceptor 1 [Manis pentadactyla]